MAKPARARNVLIQLLEASQLPAMPPKEHPPPTWLPLTFCQSISTSPPTTN